MAAVFTKARSVVAAGAYSIPETTLPNNTSSLEIRVQKFAWAASTAVTASLEYSNDNGATWLPGGSVSDDGTSVKDSFIRSTFWKNGTIRKLPLRSKIRGSVTFSASADCIITVSAT